MTHSDQRLSLEQHVTAFLKRVRPTGSGMHLDLGGGLLHVSAELETALGRPYLALIPAGHEHLEQPAFSQKTAPIDLANDSALTQALSDLMAKHRVTSMSVVGLERLPNAGRLLERLRQVATAENVTLVVSARNAATRDNATKLLFGQAILSPDETFISHATLSQLMGEAGWELSDSEDVVNTPDRQKAHVSLSASTSLGMLMTWVRSQIDDHGFTSHFVRAYRPGSTIRVPEASGKPAERPFLSVVMRTQGLRPDCLRDVLLSLAGQTDTDFEVLLVGHNLTPEAQNIVESLIQVTPVSLRQRIRLLNAENGTRATPLNVGFAAASGQYIAMLDDDDIVFGHWVETYHQLAKDYPGTLLRTVCVTQDTEQLPAITGGSVARAAGAFERRYPDHFNLYQHLSANYTPCMAVAYPRSVFHDLGLRFDENLSTTEDWDFMMRAALICGVASSPEITSIYRLWSNRPNSQTQHAKDEWRANEARIRQRLDELPAILAPGQLNDLRLLAEDAQSFQYQMPTQTLRVPAASTSRLKELARRYAKHVPPIGVKAIKKTLWLLTQKQSAPDQTREHLAIIANSSLFDVEWYLKTYPDVALANIPPDEHFLRFGGAEGRNPSPHFDSTWYLKRYPDVAAAGVNPLLHYLTSGEREGRRIRALPNNAPKPLR